MKALRWAGLVLGCALGCTTLAVTESPAPKTGARRPRIQLPDVELFFRGDQPFARRGRPEQCPGPGCEEWALGDVTKSEMVFSPDGKRFAYVREKPVAQARGEQPAHVLVRNLAGDPINEFALYRPGRPEELAWIDNRRIGYVAPQGGGVANAVYVVHDVDSGEILAARSTAELVFGPQHRHVAFVTGAGARQNLVVDGENVWPRSGVTRLQGLPVWSPDGHGLAFIDNGAAGPRLVVLVEFDDPQGDLTWSVPREALAPGLRVFWAGDSKVVVGDSPLHPRFAADWKRLQ